MAKITVLPHNTSFTAKQGEKIMDALREQGIEVNAVCGGKGTCGKCKVEVREGSLDGKALKDNTYLACLSKVADDVTLYIPTAVDAAERKSSLQQTISVDIKLAIEKHYVELTKPTVENQLPDWERLTASLPEGKKYKPAIHVLEALPQLLRKEKFALTAVVRNDQVIGLEKGDTTSEAFGVAFDIGTTSVVASLIDLTKGDILATRSMGNPQRVVGADVISRIEYASNHSDGGKYLQEKVVSALNGLVGQLLDITNVDKKYIYEATVVGNTTMQHLLLGINPSYLARAPYIPALKTGVNIAAKELGLNIAPGGEIYILPNMAGFVGSDTVGVILSTGMYKKDKPRVAIDIGTNGEIALGSKNKMLVCSTAAGPAFEGAKISCGMRAADGAIEGVSIKKDGITCQVIGDTSPVIGICGSGLIQGVAEMVVAGIIDNSGRLLSPENAKEKLSDALAERIQNIDGENVFVLVPEDKESGQKNIYISQKDIRELQLGKGAIAAGVEVLIKEMGLTLDDIEEVLIAGAFGSYIDKSSASILGLVPLVPLEKIKSVGNAAGMGSRMALLSLGLREDAQKIAFDSGSIELSTRMDFQEAYVMAMAFPGKQ